MKSPNLFYRQLEEGYSVPDDIRDFANFGASVISIISNYNREDEYIIDDIIRLISSKKYKAVTKEYEKNIGLFS